MGLTNSAPTFQKFMDSIMIDLLEGQCEACKSAEELLEYLYELESGRQSMPPRVSLPDNHGPPSDDWDLSIINLSLRHGNERKALIVDLAVAQVSFGRCKKTAH